MHKIVKVEVLDEYWLEVQFEDGNTYRFDVKPYLYGEVFEPLTDEESFKQVSIDREVGTIVWSTGADFCPDNLYHKMKESEKKEYLAY